MKLAKLLFALLVVGGISLTQGCDTDDGTAEEAGREVDEAAEETREEMDEAKDDAAEKIDDVADDVDDATDD